MPTIVHSVDKALAILEFMASRDGSAALAEIGQVLSLNASTTHHLLSTLKNRGFVEQEPSTRRYYLALKCFEVGQAARFGMDLRTLALPYLESLASQTKENSNLAVLDGQEVVYLAQAESGRMMSMFTRPGARAPLHATGVGKCLLAWQPGERLERLLHELTLTKYTGQTITERQALAKHLADVRQRGYALDDEEREEGVVCIAAPVHDHAGQVAAAVSISGPAGRTRGGNHRALVAMVTAAAGNLSAALGWRSSQGQTLPLAQAGASPSQLDQ